MAEHSAKTLLTVAFNLDLVINGSMTTVTE